MNNQFVDSTPNRMFAEIGQTIFAAASDGMFVVNDGGQLVAVNAAGCELTGYALEALLAFSLADLFFVSTLGERPLQYSDLTLEKFSRCWLRDANGHSLAVEIETRVLGNGRMLLTVRSVAAPSSRPFFEHTHLHNVINTIPDAMWLKDPDGVYLAGNPAFERFVGRQEAEVVGKTDFDLFESDLAQFFRQHDRRAMSLGKPITNEEWVTLAANGRRVLLETIKTPFFDEAGQLLGVLGIARDITERQQAEEALRQSEERFSKAFRLSPAALSLTRGDGRILDVNETYETLSGYSREELIDQDATKLTIFTPQQRADLRRRLVEQGGVLREAEMTVRMKSGERRQVLYSVEQIEIDGEACGLTLAVDITERKQMEIALQEMAQNMATAQQMTHSGSWEVRLTEDLQFIDPQIWSDECYRIFGIEPGSVSVTSDYFYKHVHPDDRESAWKTLSQAIQNRTEAAYEYRLIRPDGSIRTLHDRTTVVVDERTGRPVKVVGIVRDVTESKEAAATIVQLNRRMELILNSAGEGIYGTDVDGRVTFVNPAMAQMVGWEPDELLGQSAHAIFHHTRADGRPYPDAECSIRQATQAGHSCHAADDTYWHKDGTPLAVEYTSTPIWQEEQIVGTVVVVKNITERKQVAEEQALLEEQLRQSQKMESIGRLAGGVAHDFNNQLTIIRLYSDLMRRKMAKNDPLLPKLEQIRQATEHAAGLTGQLLAFSRKQVLEPVVLNMNDLVTRLKKMLGRLIGEDITLSTVLEPSLWPVMADPGQLEQVIMNLIINARDAMPTGGMLTIETGNRMLDERIATTHLDAPLGPCVMLVITDTGHGMDEVVQKQIFEPFFTTKERSKGTGLGLATVHGIVRQSGGAIFVYSEPEQGSSFKIYLPATGSVNDETATDPSFASLQRGNETILLVEDEAALRDLVCVTLQEIGYTVLEADDSNHALLLAEQYSEIDLLLTDVVMPQMSGREIAQRITAQQPEMKVLFMSGYMDDAVIRHGLLAAEVDFLAKPFTHSDLASKVRKVLDK